MAFVLDFKEFVERVLLDEFYVGTNHFGELVGVFDFGAVRLEEEVRFVFRPVVFDGFWIEGFKDVDCGGDAVGATIEEREPVSVKVLEFVFFCIGC